MHGTSLYIATYVGLVFSYSTRYTFHDFITCTTLAILFQPHPCLKSFKTWTIARNSLSFRTLKWMNLSIQLGLEDNALEAIKIECINKVDECRTAMFREWLRTI